MTKLTVKCSDEEIAAWREAAWDQRLSLSAWVRTRLNGRTGADGPPISPEDAVKVTLGDAASRKCSRASRHHINHSGKPCPECGYPKEA